MLINVLTARSISRVQESYSEYVALMEPSSYSYDGTYSVPVDLDDYSELPTEEYETPETVTEMIEITTSSEIPLDFNCPNNQCPIEVDESPVIYVVAEITEAVAITQASSDTDLESGRMSEILAITLPLISFFFIAIICICRYKELRRMCDQVLH